MNSRVFFNKKDFMVIFVIMLVFALAYTVYRIYNEGNETYINVIYEGKVINTIDLSGKDTVYTPKECPNVTIEVANNKARVKSSDCPDKICVNTGWIAMAGQSAVCLPNRISIVVKSKKGNEVDTAI